MKYSFTLVAVGAALAAAQSLTDLPQCGQTCINNMLALAPSLGCQGAEASCLCSKVDFGYGIRDCSSAVCVGDSAAVQSAISYAVGYCQSALSGSATASGAVPALTGTGAVGGAGGNGTATSTTATSGASSASGSGASSAITTAPLTEAITENGSTLVTTTGETTIYAGGSGASSTAASGAESSSTGSGAGGAGMSTTAQASSSASDASGAGATGSSSSTGGVAVMTAAPLLGMAALAVLAL